MTQYTLAQLQQAAESDKFDTILEQAGIPQNTDANSNADKDNAPVLRRKWSELKEFDRTTFDMEEYQKTLAKE